MTKQTSSRPRRHTALRVVLAVLACLVLGIAALAFCFREQISLLIYAMQTSSEQISALQSENDERIGSVLNELQSDPTVTLRDLTEEERGLLAEGQLSEEDALALIRGEKTLEQLRESTTPAPKPDGTPSGAVNPPATADLPSTQGAETAEVPSTAEIPSAAETPSTAEVPTPSRGGLPAVNPEPPKPTKKTVDGLLAEIYLLRATYLNAIDRLLADAKAEYRALPKAERTAAARLRFADRVIADGATLEAACDEKMDAILAEMKTLLLEQGGRTEILAEIRTAYLEQKRLKKAELYNHYKKYVT